MWSYYGSRLPGAISHSISSTDIDVYVGGGLPVRIRIRINGFDYDVVEEVFAKGVYKEEITNVSRVIDLGANIGIASLYFATRYPGVQICAVEPSSPNLILLEHNVKANNAPVRVVPGAVGEKDGDALFVITGDPRQAFCEATGRRTTDQGARVKVRQYSVPSLMHLMGWEEVDLLKIDIEGSEVGVLGGRPQWLNRVRAIVGEGHEGVGYTIDACRRDLEPMGFEVQMLEMREGAAMLFFARRRAATC
jgi:FkbM family methyltransferase